MDGLGGFGWFVGVWVVMMAAMMFPSVAPTVALYSRMTKQRSPAAPWLFVAGYLLIWAVAGWWRTARRSRRRVGGGDRCPGTTPAGGSPARRCSSPPATSSRRSRTCAWASAAARSASCSVRGATGAAARCGWARSNGAWCVGCCWALMASLFALGVMSVSWMAVVAGLIAVEKTLPWRRIATYGTAAVLLALGVLVLVAPHALPALTIPTEHMSMSGGCSSGVTCRVPRAASRPRAASPGWSRRGRRSRRWRRRTRARAAARARPRRARRLRAALRRSTRGQRTLLGARDQDRRMIAILELGGHAEERTAAEFRCVGDLVELVEKAPGCAPGASGPRRTAGSRTPWLLPAASP